MTLYVLAFIQEEHSLYQSIMYSEGGEENGSCQFELNRQFGL